jgi:hypothetical protein
MVHASTFSDPSQLKMVTIIIQMRVWAFKGQDCAVEEGHFVVLRGKRREVSLAG